MYVKATDGTIVNLNRVTSIDKRGLVAYEDYDFAVMTYDREGRPVYRLYQGTSQECDDVLERIITAFDEGKAVYRLIENGTKRSE